MSEAIGSAFEVLTSRAVLDASVGAAVALLVLFVVLERMFRPQLRGWTRSCQADRYRNARNGRVFVVGFDGTRSRVFRCAAPTRCTVGNRCIVCSDSEFIQHLDRVDSAAMWAAAEADLADR